MKTRKRILFIVIILITGFLLSACTLVRTLFSENSEISFGEAELLATNDQMNAFSSIPPVMYAFEGYYYMAYVNGTDLDWDIKIDRSSDFKNFENVYNLDVLNHSDLSFSNESTHFIFFTFNEELYCAVPCYDIYYSDGDNNFQYRLLKFNGTQFTIVQENFINNQANGTEYYFSIAEFGGSLYVSCTQDDGSFSYTYVYRYANGDFNRDNALKVYSAEINLISNTSLVVYNNTLYFAYQNTGDWDTIELYETSDGSSWNAADQIQGPSTNSLGNTRFQLCNGILYLLYFYMEGGTNRAIVCIRIENDGFADTEEFRVPLADAGDSQSPYYFYLAKVPASPLGENSELPFIISYIDPQDSGVFQHLVVFYNPGTQSFSDPLINVFNSESYSYQTISQPFVDYSSIKVALFYLTATDVMGDGYFYSAGKQ